MASKKKDAQYVNITLNNQEEDREELILSLAGVLRQLRKYFLPWLLVSVICGGLVSGMHILLDASAARPVKALVSFNYPGIEKGKNPDGTDFDKATLKSPEVIEKALKECNLDKGILENVRQGISIEPQIPSDVLDRITTYAYLYEKAGTGSLNAANEMLDVSWYSTQYTIKFDYSATSLSRAAAADLLDEMTKQYRDYFIRRYGYNNQLGISLGNVDYTEYDYAQAIDIMDDTLRQLRSYVNDLANDDNVRFRSTVTGYTFADLRSSINTVRDQDIATASSFISQNNVTKDKDRLQAYYEYRIEALGRDQAIYEERIASTKESIEKYEKDSIYIFSSEMNTQTTTASDQYDKMIAQKLSLQTDLSETVQRIEFFHQRLAALRKTTVGSTDKAARVESDLARIETKVTNLVQLVEDTTIDYYKNYSLADAYSILVPPSASTGESVASGIKDAFKTVLALELILLGLYMLIVFCATLREAFRQNAAKRAAAAENAEEDSADEPQAEPAETAPQQTESKNSRKK